MVKVTYLEKNPSAGIESCGLTTKLLCPTCTFTPLSRKPNLARAGTRHQESQTPACKRGQSWVVSALLAAQGQAHSRCSVSLLTEFCSGFLDQFFFTIILSPEGSRKKSRGKMTREKVPFFHAWTWSCVSKYHLSPCSGHWGDALGRVAGHNMLAYKHHAC